MVEFVHHKAELNGLSYHFVTAGQGPAILLLHGFPDLWIGWRPVMEHLVAAGYSVIAPDLRGFGDSQAAPGPDQASGFDLLGDLIALLDHLGHVQVAVVGHDWGAEVGWTIVRLRPDRFGAIVSLSIPFTPRGDASLPQLLAANAPPDFYMLYFLQEGVAERELDSDPKAFLRRLFYTNWGGRPGTDVPIMRLGANGRLIDGLDEPPTSANLLTEQELDIYASSFARTGFRGALNTYRSLHRNWELLAGWADIAVDVPAFYISGDRDIVLHFPGMKSMVEQMTSMLPQAAPPVILEGVGHFVQMERPGQVADLIASFLGRNHPCAGTSD
ncbi:alpha/beta hydrolase [Sphingobium cupriresistens]|uniref:Alpha/beta hydrolase n=1 Tax=Sphingobium cupriresistens TaxID=1132417 RepID=A0A8G2DX64_9SPHN|nr:alpha/beta hydrolase [Sphingobium cupriresistens]